MVQRLSLCVAALIAGGCGADEVTVDASRLIDANATDARRVDARIDAGPTCVSPAGTADVTAEAAAASEHYANLYAAALSLSGPVAPVAGGAPMILSVLFTNADELAPIPTACCINNSPDCCPAGATGLTATTEAIVAGAEVGDHPVTFRKLDNAAYTVDGTLTITTFVDPFTDTPGRVAGSVSGTMGNRTVSGTFDHEFCPQLLTATI